jgi:hypothetical protein
MFRAAWRRGETASRPEAPGDDDVSSERAVEWLRVLGTTGLTALLPENVPNEWAVGAPDRCWTRDYNLHSAHRGPR